MEIRDTRWNGWFFYITSLLPCSTNNHSQTVLQLLLEAVSTYGIPSRVRCDRGVSGIARGGSKGA